MHDNTVDGNKVRVFFHVENGMILRVSTKVVDKAIGQLQTEYESIFKDGSGAMKVCRGKSYKYLGMALGYSNKGEFCVTMCDYLDRILGTFDKAVKKHGDGWILVTKRCLRKTAARDKLVAGNEDCKRLSTKAVATFHKIVAKVLCVSKRAIPGTSPSVAFLTMRVRSPNTDDWEKLKLIHLMEHLRGNKD